MIRRPFSHWLLLLSLTVMWGMSFLFTKIALRTFSPDRVVAMRFVLAGILLLAAMWLTGRRLPQDGPRWRYMVAMAMVGNVVPFSLIAWGQQRIDSGLAGILMAVMPLATIVLAHFTVSGERLDLRRAIGFVLGFVGIVVLTGPDALLELRGEGTAFLSELAVLGGALCYAVNTILTRRRPAGDSLSASAGVILIAAAVMLPVASRNGLPSLEGVGPLALGSILFLGCVSTALATVAYFKLIAIAGPGFMALTNYLIPLWAVAVGFLFLGEVPSWRALAALVLILSGIALSEGRRRSSLQ
jgi:drug/metabolite transporter (DMT)-like permease